ncbi:MAG: hypothetical protein ABWY57_06450, partial [Mycetocola sp.]
MARPLGVRKSMSTSPNSAANEPAAATFVAGFVQPGSGSDRWTVIGVQRNGSAEVRRHGQRWGSAVLLPAEYVKRHVELGYAVTSHRAQGITTDTAH